MLSKCALYLLAVLASLAANPGGLAAAAPEPRTDPAKLFARDNLVAWCIVPFDAKKRGPAERAAMLKRLGFTRFAYDYRAEHVPTFDAEMDALKQQQIELTAWWFPRALNDEAQQILEVLKRDNLKIQLWISGSGKPTNSADEQAALVKAEAARIRPIALAAAEIGCTVALYNHGGWFGEPENQLAILEELKLPNVGLVYNLHHGHEHLERFSTLLEKMLPHLWCLNLNGMVADGERTGRKILPLGQGDLDLSLLKAILASGYRGPIGILGHTDDDAEERLLDNLDGLDWLVKQLEGKPAGERPRPRTPVPPRQAAIAPADAKAASAHATTPAPAQHLSEHKNGLTNHHHPPIAGTAKAALPAEFDAQFVADFVAAADKRGAARRGLEVFRTAQFACLSCHRVGEHGGAVGPALSDVGRRLKPEEIAEAVLWPKRQVKPEYTSWVFVLRDGRARQGYKRGETAASIELFDAATQKIEILAKDEIDEQHEAGTLMPDGLAAAMTETQRLDLAKLLFELGRTPGLEREVTPPDSPAQFTYGRAPFVRLAHPLSTHPVNRDRIYDFYLKEALFFRDQPQYPHLLPAFPGLDGGKLGHWGNQDDTLWNDGRWNETDLGTLLGGVFRAPGDRVIPKGVCVRLGDAGEIAACFNPQTLGYDALWNSRSGFLKFSAVRHGFLGGLQPGGPMLDRLGEPLPPQPFVYRGFYRYGPRVIFSYRLGDVEMLDAPWVSQGRFERIVAPACEHPLSAALHGGPAQWPQTLTTRGKLGSDLPYAIDTILPPFENPWKALMFFSDHDFLPDGSALLATMTGDVWHVTALDAGLSEIKWRRFASGLHQPLGLVVADGNIYVLGRDQITRLRDLNGDGEADFYECFSNRLTTSPGGHDFVCGLARDSQGRFYTASGNQGLLRISADGQNVAALATGFRNPDGLALLDGGALTLPCSEGDWTPASMICLVDPAVPARHFGHGGPKDGQPPALPLVYLPRGLDNSSGGQAVVRDERFGPLAQQLVHFSYGQGSWFLILRDEVDGQPQGAVVPMPGDFRSGVHRGKPNPKDGQLYVSGMAGWGTYTPDDGCLHRVRYTGTRVQLPRSAHVHENGVLVAFVEPIDAGRAANATAHFAQVWNYRYGPGYGSPELAPSHPGVVGHEALDIASVSLVDDRTLFVELPGLQPVNQLHLVLQVDAGAPQELFVTVHKLDKPFTKFPGYQPASKLIAAHPQSIDLTLLGAVRKNRWRSRAGLKPTAELDIAPGKDLTWSVRTLRAKRGEAVKLTFTNSDVVPHNWVLVRPGSLARVGDLSNRLIADPEAIVRQYIPQTDDVLVYTDIVSPQESFTIYFRAPEQRGVYPYLCTFPGHWMVMNGELLVE